MPFWLAFLRRQSVLFTWHVFSWLWNSQIFCMDFLTGKKRLCIYHRSIKHRPFINNVFLPCIIKLDWFQRPQSSAAVICWHKVTCVMGLQPPATYPNTYSSDFSSLLMSDKYDLVVALISRNNAHKCPGWPGSLSTSLSLLWPWLDPTVSRCKVFPGQTNSDHF